MQTIDTYVHVTAPKAKITDKSILPLLSHQDQDIWLTHGQPPKRDFPSFSDVATEVGAIKETLRAKVNGSTGKLHLDKSGTRPKKGLMFAPSASGNGPARAFISEAEIDTLIKPELLQAYFDQGQQTLQRTAQHPGIAHDKDVGSDEFWLPGLLLIDEIFHALLTTALAKITAVNNALEAKLEELDSEAGSFSSSAASSYDAAVADLEKFAEAIGTNQAIGDAAKYVPFINYDAPKPTYIKLVKSSDDFIIGAIVYVQDWAGGLHSSGSAVP